jgi:NlpC/P60 family putative phage cell wall peptidase
MATHNIHHIAQRAAVLAEAKTWLRTPYHHQARIKGAGVDCLLLLCEVYQAAGLIPYVDPTPYPQNWHVHRSDERYLDGVTQYARQTTTAPNVGDFVLFKFGRAYSHAGIYAGNDLLIHSLVDRGVIQTSLQEPPLAGRAALVYTFWLEVTA